MVHGLLNHGHFQFAWVKNKHLNLDPEEIFKPIDGIEFVLTRNNLITEKDGVKWWYYPGKYNQSEIFDCYKLILNSLYGSEEPKRSSLGIHCRFLFKNQNYFVPHLILSIEAIGKLESVGLKSAAIYSDKYRDEITRFLQNEGIEVIQPLAEEMKNDYDRMSKDSFLFYLRDWQAMLKSDTILTGSRCSSALHPFMASGKELIRLRK